MNIANAKNNLARPGVKAAKNTRRSTGDAAWGTPTPAGVGENAAAGPVERAAHGGRTSAVSRAYFKLSGAASAFNFDFKDKVVLDIGSSTGGFTEYALERGAKKVIAVEKGTNQMKSPLRDDPRVDLHEKTDVFDMQISSFDGPAGRGPRKNLVCVPSPDIIVADVSFVPLTKVLAYAKLKLARSDTDFLVMLKPQFETADPRDLNRGIVKNESIRRKIIKNFEQWLRAHGYIIVKKHDNTLAGKHGNVERFYHLRLAK